MNSSAGCFLLPGGRICDSKIADRKMRTGRRFFFAIHFSVKHLSVAPASDLDMRYLPSGVIAHVLKLRVSPLRLIERGKTAGIIITRSVSEGFLQTRPKRKTQSLADASGWDWHKCATSKRPCEASWVFDFEFFCQNIER